MHHILEADDFTETGARDPADAAAAPRAGWHIPWERAIRCLLLLAVLAVTGVMAWRPALLRLSQLMFMVSPSRGDSLAWKPGEEAPPQRLAPRRATPEPAEWRPTAGAPDGGRAERSRFGPGERPLWRGASQFPARWRRLSGNPWNWRDDAVPPPPRRSAAVPPAQKPATDFRVKDANAWGTEEEASAPVPDKDDTARAEEELPPLRIPELSSLPAAAAEPAEPAAAPEAAKMPEENAAAQTDWTRLVVPPPGATPESSASVASAPQSGSPIDAPESADWLNQEITGPIAGAYLTIYPKLKFIGLCVPGQGYIRKYNQVATPGDTTGEKVAAADGRTPYGKYYIAARRRDGGGPRLVLSWPSPEDARRLGLDSGQTALIEDAWLGQGLPPQDTPAGGGIALTGLRERQETTDGGFALEPPHMEEIYTALPNGAWVFIQE